MHKIVIHFAVAAQGYSNVVGDRFSADDSFFLLSVGDMLQHQIQPGDVMYQPVSNVSVHR